MSLPSALVGLTVVVVVLGAVLGGKWGALLSLAEGFGAVVLVAGIFLATLGVVGGVLMRLRDRWTR
jgi:hypothetical protein